MIVPWFQIFTVLSRDGQFNTRVVRVWVFESLSVWIFECRTTKQKQQQQQQQVQHNKIRVGDTILFVKSLVKEMAWSGVVENSQEALESSYEEREFLDNDQDLEFAIVRDMRWTRTNKHSK